MAFKTDAPTGGSGNFEPRNFPVPKSGSRKARVSLIVDMGIQERDDYVDPVTKEAKPQDPCRQVAVFVDLVADKVDYGGEIGVKQYRLALNNTFKGAFKGINFYTGPAKDADGNIMRDKPWGLHPASPLTKLCKAVGRPELANEPKPRAGVDIEPLLGMAFMAQVEVKETEDKNGKKDNEGNVIVYKNVNYKGCAPVPNQEDDDGNDIGPIPVPKLEAAPMAISFDDVTKDQIQFIRGGLLKQIKLAQNYAGSQMQKAVEAWEAEQKAKAEKEEGEAEQPKAEKEKPKSRVAPKKTTPVDDMDDDIPF